MKGVAAVGDERNIDPGVERDEAGVVFYGQSQKVEIRERPRSPQRGKPTEVAKGHIVGEKLMPGRGAVLEQDLPGQFG